MTEVQMSGAHVKLPQLPLEHLPSKYQVRPKKQTTLQNNMIHSNENTR